MQISLIYKFQQPEYAFLFSLKGASPLFQHALKMTHTLCTGVICLAPLAYATCHRCDT